jgi:hypothetical protein
MREINKKKKKKNFFFLKLFFLFLATENDVAPATLAALAT